MAKKKVELSQEDMIALAQMAYAENASEDDDTVKMTVQTAINRLLSGRGKEFGKTIPEILKKGYYAVSSNSPLHQQAVSGKLPDSTSQVRYSEIEKLVQGIDKDADYGNAMFYFKPEEEAKMKKKGNFNFNAVKPTGKVGKYNTYSY